MLRIAGQTAGQIGLNFFVDTQGWPGSIIGYKKSKIVIKIFFLHFFSWASPISN